MFIETVRNRNSPPCILLRESYRENGKVKHRTLANLSKCDPEVIAGFKEVLKRHRNGEAPDFGNGFRILRSLPHGHVQAVITAIKALELDKVLLSRRCLQRDLVVAMIAARILFPGSKLATARAMNRQCEISTLSALCDIEAPIDENDLYEAMDWLLQRQNKIESALAARHLSNGSLVLYDVTSSYFEGTTCPLGAYGYSRDGKKGKLQVVYGLLCDGRGCPVAVEVFEGNTADPNTLAIQIVKLRQRFGLERVVIVGDRGMITQARIDKELRGVEGLDWITALNSRQIKKLCADHTLQLELFDQRNFAEVTHADFPDERLVVCRNPHLADRRERKRQELLEATEALLEEIARATRRKKRALRGRARIGLRVGKVINKFKMAKHFTLEITDKSFRWQRREDKIAQEKALDGLYVVRTSVDAEVLGSAQAVERYKDLSLVENAFRSLKTVDLKVRPIFHRSADRVRAHIFLCMLAYYVEWHMREVLAPMLFEDDEPKIDREDPVIKRAPSQSAQAKAKSKQTAQGDPVHSFQTLLKDLATMTLNVIASENPQYPQWQQQTEPTPLQKEVFERLGKLSKT